MQNSKFSCNLSCNFNGFFSCACDVGLYLTNFTYICNPFQVTEDGKYCLVLVFKAKALQLSDFEQRQVSLLPLNETNVAFANNSNRGFSCFSVVSTLSSTF